MNFDDYGFSEEDFAVSREIAHAQWLNPQNKVSALGITAENAAKAMFEPKKAGWEYTAVHFTSGEDKLWVTKEPRVVILNGSSIIANGIEGDASPRFMDVYEPVLDVDGNPVFDKKNKQVKEWKASIPYDSSKYSDPNHIPFGKTLFVVVGKDNELLSMPIILKTGSAATMTMVNLYKQSFVPQLIELYQSAIGKKLPVGQKPTCRFLSRFVFEPILEQGMVGGENSSAGTRADKFKPLVLDRFSEIALNPKTDKETVDTIQVYVDDILAYVNPLPIPVKPQEEKLEAVDDYIKLDSTLPPVTKAQLQEIAVKTQSPQSSLVNEQILSEYARLKLAANPEKGKELIQKHFGAEATHKSLTPDQKVEWLEILKKEKVESEPVPEITPEVIEEAVAEDIAEDVTPEPVEVETGSIPDEAFRDLTTQITVRETELKLTKLQIRGIIQANFGKVARNLLTDGEMLTYLDVLNALEVRQ